MNTALKKARERSGLTQVETAAKATVSYRAYQNYEAEEREPKVSAAIRIAQVLDTTVENLFGAATPDNRKEPDGNQARS